MQMVSNKDFIGLPPYLPNLRAALANLELSWAGAIVLGAAFQHLGFALLMIGTALLCRAGADERPRGGQNGLPSLPVKLERNSNLHWVAPSPMRANAPQNAGYAFFESDASPKKASIANRRASARPSFGALARMPNGEVVKRVAAAESTAQCETSNARAPA